VRTLYPLVFLVWAAGVLGAGVSPDIWVAALAMVLSGFGNGVAFPLTVVIVQRATTDAVRGRAFTLIISAHNAVLGFSMLAAGAFTQAVGPRWVYVAGAVSLLLGGITAAAFLRAPQTQAALARGQAA
jgi:MFS family permease